MVFQDGWLYFDPEGEIRAGLVFDELIERGERPVTHDAWWAIGGLNAHKLRRRLSPRGGG